MTKGGCKILPFRDASLFHIETIEEAGLYVVARSHVAQQTDNEMVVLFQYFGMSG